MIELQPSQYPSAEFLFHSTSYGALAYGTLEGGHPGRVFVDNRDTPAYGLVCTRVGYYFLAGRPGNLTALRALFLDELAPQQRASIGDPQMLLFYDSPDWKEPLFSLFADRQPIPIRKKRMVLAPGAAERLAGWQARLPAGLRLTAITQELFQSNPDLAGEISIFWGSWQAFNQRSLGYCLMDGDSVASVCEAVLIGNGEAEISIATAEPYRRQGLGFLTACAFIEACCARGLKPVWGCWPNNEPSVALARKLGFVDHLEQEICFWEETVSG